MMPSPFLILLLAVGVGGSGGVPCAEISKSRGNQDCLTDKTMFLLYRTDCEACTASFAHNSFESYCYNSKSNDEEGLPFTELCQQNREFVCAGSKCCCRGPDCFDRFRYRLTDAHQRADASLCNVRRVTADGIATTLLARLECNVCTARINSLGLEQECIDERDTQIMCGKAKQLVGGSLACSKDARQCCCRGSNCSDEFERFFFKFDVLADPLITTPYSLSTGASLPVLILWLLVFLFVTMPVY